MESNTKKQGTAYKFPRIYWGWLPLIDARIDVWVHLAENRGKFTDTDEGESCAILSKGGNHVLACFHLRIEEATVQGTNHILPCVTEGEEVYWVDGGISHQPS